MQQVEARVNNSYFVIKLVDYGRLSELGLGVEEQQQKQGWTREAFYCQFDCFWVGYSLPSIRLGDEGSCD